MKKLIALVLVFCMAIILVPALAESADVAGEWVCSFAGHTIPLTINADGTFSYSRSFFGISLSFEIKMLQDGMVAVTIDIDGNVATLYMIRVDVATKEPAA